MIENYEGYKNGSDTIPLIDKYRPKTFEDFLGNEDVIESLQNTISSKLTHTFLFLGPVGCGKTTLSRIVAKEIGKAVVGSDTFYDIIELNSANYRGIDSVRDIIQISIFASRRIYIFDEAHKMTIHAQDAGLKLFEEPPPHVFFIFCTNWPNKLDDALKSRFFNFELLPLFQHETFKLLKRICEGEGWKLPGDVLVRVANESRGVPREAIKRLAKAYYSPYHFTIPSDDNRVFAIQDKQDLEYFRSITKNEHDYNSVLISSAKIEKFMGKDVIIIQNKSEAGRKSTEAFLRRIGNVPKRVRTVEMPGKENKSLENWITSLSESSSNEKLIQKFENIVNNPPELKFPSLRTAPDQLIVSFDTFNRIDLPSREMIMSPWLEEGSLILLASPPGIGKTLFAMELAASCSEGRDAMDGLWHVEKPVPVLTVDGELHWEDLIDRSKLLGLRKSLVLSKVFYEHKNGQPPLNIADEEGIRGPLTSYIIKRGIKLLILDNIYSLVIGLDHNFEREWSPLNQWLISLRNKGIAVIIVHHTGKKGDQLGTSSRKFNIDYSFTLEKKYSPGDKAGDCTFSIIVDKERRPVRDIRKKVFVLSDGKWTVRDFSENENRAAENKLRQIAIMLVDGKPNKEVAEHFSCSRANISQRKSKLIELELIRETDGSDGKYLEFTETGREWVEQQKSS
jgi:DNA polymerase III delta prime subunit